jgi:hypothetical protein
VDPPTVVTSGQATTNQAFSSHLVPLPLGLADKPGAVVRVCGYNGAAAGTWRIDNVRIETVP